MSLYDYTASRKILANDPPFYALIMAAMSRADTINQVKLQAMWPDVWAEANARYNAPGAKLPEEWEAEAQGKSIDQDISFVVTMGQQPSDDDDSDAATARWREWADIERDRKP